MTFLVDLGASFFVPALRAGPSFTNFLNLRGGSTTCPYIEPQGEKMTIYSIFFLKTFKRAGEGNLFVLSESRSANPHCWPTGASLGCGVFAAGAVPPARRFQHRSALPGCGGCCCVERDVLAKRGSMESLSVLTLVVGGVLTRPPDLAWCRCAFAKELRNFQVLCTLEVEGDLPPPRCVAIRKVPEPPPPLLPVYVFAHSPRLNLKALASFNSGGGSARDF